LLFNTISTINLEKLVLMQELISIDILKLVFKFAMLLQINETNVHQGLDMLGIPGKTSRKTLLS
jgi:hypothetical protein